MTNMTRKNVKMMRVEVLKEVKEKEIVEVMLKGIDLETVRKCQEKNVESA